MDKDFSDGAEALPQLNSHDPMSGKATIRPSSFSGPQQEPHPFLVKPGFTTSKVDSELYHESLLQSTALSVVREFISEDDGFVQPRRPTQPSTTFQPSHTSSHFQNPGTPTEQLVRTPSLTGSTTTTLSTCSRPPPSPETVTGQSWAQILKEKGPAAAHTPHSSISTQYTTLSTDLPSPPPDSAFIARNSQGQRLDPPIPHDRAEVQRVKAMKLCNVYYLRGSCAKSTCTHRHDYTPSLAELKCLAVVARMAPCNRGTACDAAACIYGHACPAPRGRGGELCAYGQGCKFSAGMHGVARH